jgi:hypothetical protein
MGSMTTVSRGYRNFALRIRDLQSTCQLWKEEDRFAFLKEVERRLRSVPFQHCFLDCNPSLPLLRRLYDGSRPSSSFLVIGGTTFGYLKMDCALRWEC